MLVINAGTREKDVNWVVENTQEFDCQVEHLSDDYTQIAIQGPKGAATLQKLTDADLSKVKFYWFTLRYGLRTAEYADCPHRLHGGRRLRDICSQR